MAKSWITRSPPPTAAYDPAPTDAYEKRLAIQLQMAACGQHGAPVIRGLIGNLEQRFENKSRLRSIAATFLDEAQCKASRDLSEEDKVKLRTFRDEPPLQQ